MDIYQNQVKTFEKQNVSFCLLYSFTSLKSCLSSLVPPVPSAVFTHLPWRVLPPSSYLEEISLRSAALPSALSAVHSQSQDFALYLFLPYAALSVCMCVSALGLLVSSCRLPTAVFLAFPWWLRQKESACNAGDLGLIPGLGRFPGGEHGNPLQCSCLENPTNSGVWQATVAGVTKSQTQLSD